MERGKRAFGSVGLLLTILVVGAMVFAGRQVVPFYYYYYEFLGQMEAQARNAATNTDGQIRRYLVQRARELELPLGSPEDDIVITREGNKITIETHYTEVFYVDLGEGYSWDLWFFKFFPRVEMNF